MSTKKLQIDISILDRVKSAYNIHSDADLATFLGVNQSTVANWRHRNSFNTDLILSKCKDLDLHWLLFGEKKSHNEIINHELSDSDTPDTRVSENADTYLKVVPNRSKIDSQERRIIELEAENKLLKELLTQKLNR